MNPGVHNSCFCRSWIFQVQFKQGAALLTLKMNITLTTSSFYPIALRDPGIKQTRELKGRAVGRTSQGGELGFQTLANLNSLELWASTERPFLWLVSEQITGSCRGAARKEPRQPGDPASTNRHAPLRVHQLLLEEVNGGSCQSQAIRYLQYRNSCLSQWIPSTVWSSDALSFFRY